MAYVQSNTYSMWHTVFNKYYQFCHLSGHFLNLSLRVSDTLRIPSYLKYTVYQGLEGFQFKW